MKHQLYQITNVVNGKYYIGAHSCPSAKCMRFGECTYMGSGYALKAAVKKHGVSQFRKNILATVSNERLLYDLERAVVTPEFIATDANYNSSVGGDKPPSRKGARMPVDAMARTIAANTGRACSPATRSKLAAAQRGRTFSAEHKAALRRAHAVKRCFREQMDILGLTFEDANVG